MSSRQEPRTTGSGTISGRNAIGIDSWIDLRGAVIENGTLDINAIEMGERTFINMDNTTVIGRLRIHNALRIHGRRGRWIGDPADTASRLPTNLVVVVGSTESPAILDLGIRSADSYFDMGPVHFNASTGGSFTGRLSRLRVAHSTHGGTGPNVSTMPHYGMRWDGDQTAALQALVDTDSITFDDAAISKPVEVYAYRDVTYVGIAPIPIGSILLLP